MKCAIGLLVAAVVFSGCAHKEKKHVAPAPPPTIRPKLKPMTSVQPGYAESGKASWYGHPYHGRPAADGEIYDMETMVAAHRTLPFQTWVRVYNLDNNKTVEVRIVDRGPFVDGRIIDLSHAAARVIEMIGPGTANVRMEILSAPATVGQAHFGVQVGAFRNRENADRLRRAMEAKYGRARLVQRADTPGVWHVVVGMESTQDGASALADRIRGEDSSVNSALVVRLDSV